jgi:stage V sporulation protein SpoVS
VHGASRVRRGPFIIFPDIDQQKFLARGLHALEAVDIDLLDPGFCIVNQSQKAFAVMFCWVAHSSILLIFAPIRPNFPSIFS